MGFVALPSQPVTRLLQKTRINLRPASSSSRHDRNPSSRISFLVPARASYSWVLREFAIHSAPYLILANAALKVLNFRVRVFTQGYVTGRYFGSTPRDVTVLAAATNNRNGHNSTLGLDGVQPSVKGLDHIFLGHLS